MFQKTCVVLLYECSWCLNKLLYPITICTNKNVTIFTTGAVLKSGSGGASTLASRSKLGTLQTLGRPVSQRSCLISIAGDSRGHFLLLFIGRRGQEVGPWLAALLVECVDGLANRLSNVFRQGFSKWHTQLIHSNKRF